MARTVYKVCNKEYIFNKVSRVSSVRTNHIASLFGCSRATSFRIIEDIKEMFDIKENIIPIDIFKSFLDKVLIYDLED